MFGLATTPFAAYPFVGTWKLDPAKSTSMWENGPARTRRLKPSPLTARQSALGQYPAGLHDAKCPGASRGTKDARSSIHHVRREPQRKAFK